MPPIFRKKQLKDLFLNPITIYSIGVLLFGLLLLFVHRLPGDDLVFPIQIKPYATVIAWVEYRYQSWSGRIFAESFEYIFSVLPLVYWKIVSFVLYGASSVFLFLYYRLFTKQPTPYKDRLMISLALLLPLMMDSHIISDSMLWVSGSMNYSWLTSLALVGFYPFLYVAIRKRLPHWSLCLIGSLAIVIAASSQEQVGAVLVVFAGLFAGYLLYKRQNLKIKTSVYIALQTLLVLAAFVISIKAPGDQKRIASEAATHLPDFYTTPLPAHIEYASRWFIDGMINHSGLLLVLNWLLLIALFIHKKHTEKFHKVDYAITSILALGLLYLALKSFSGITFLFTFYPTWKPHVTPLSLILLIPWTVVLIATVLAPIVLRRKKATSYLLSLLFAASLASAAMITLSPSMYASGLRVFYVPSLILVLTSYYLFDQVYDRYKTTSLVTFAVIICLSAPQYLSLLGHEVRH